MCFFEYANLYVEKYADNTLMLDFITEGEFIYFRNDGDYTENVRLSEYSPTMLLFHNVKRVKVSEGDILTVPMKELIIFKRNNSNLKQNNFEEERPYGVFFTFNNSQWLEGLFLERIAYKNNKLKSKLTEQVEGTWDNGVPCALSRLSNNICVEVEDVGQGNTNLIYDSNSLAIFDFGANMFASEYELKSIVYNLQDRFRDLRDASLIISHWDYDHYSLLTIIDEKVLQNICCAFIPENVISLTAKQTVNKLKKCCKYVRTFSSPTPKDKRSIGITPVIEEDRYVLYIGDKCKDKNKSGLLLAIKGSIDITVMGADHTNWQLGNCIRFLNDSNYKYDVLNIVVPHHGGYSGKIKAKIFSQLTPGIAAVSVGKNSYKHPNQSTLDMYTDAGFKVLRTDWERRNIIIKMK